MEYMTTTNLRTKTTQLVSVLKKNNRISLIHRSKIVAIIQPVQTSSKPFDVHLFAHYLKEIKFVPTSHKRRKIIYQTHLNKKYGKNIP
ncbi:MAG: hypothetical protein AAB929_03970 [Patescibacteria group bacterium]